MPNFVVTLPIMFDCRLDADLCIIMAVQLSSGALVKICDSLHAKLVVTLLVFVDCQLGADFCIVMAVQLFSGALGKI